MRRALPVLAFTLLGAAARAQEKGEGWVVHAVALAPGGGTVAFGRLHAEKGTAQLCLVDVATDRRRELPAPGSVMRTLQFTADGKRLASGADDGRIRIVDVATGEEVAEHEAHRGWILSVALSPDGSLVLSGGMDRVLRLAETATGKAWRVQRGQTITVVAFAPDGRLACGLDDGDVELWRRGEERPQSVLRGSDRAFAALAFTPDGRRLAAAGRAEEGFVFDVAKGEVERRWRGHTKGVRDLLFEPGGETLWAASGDRSVRRVRLRDGVVLVERRLEAVPMALAIAASGDALVADVTGATTILRAE